MEILKEEELAYVVGGGDRINALHTGFGNGWERGVRGITDGIGNICNAATSVIDNTRNASIRASRGIGNIAGGVTYVAAAEAVVYGVYKLGEYIIGKVEKIRK